MKRDPRSHWCPERQDAASITLTNLPPNRFARSAPITFLRFSSSADRPGAWPRSSPSRSTDMMIGVQTNSAHSFHFCRAAGRRAPERRRVSAPRPEPVADAVLWRH